VVVVCAAVLAGGLVAPGREGGVAAVGSGPAPARARGPGLEFVARDDLVIVTR